MGRTHKKCKKEVANRLKELRLGGNPEGIRYTQKRIGKVLGVEYSAVSDRERGKTQVTFENAEKLATFYGVSPYYILCQPEPLTKEEEENRQFQNLRLMDKNNRFISSLGIQYNPGKQERYYDAETGEEVMMEEDRLHEKTDGEVNPITKEREDLVVTPMIAPSGQNIKQTDTYFETVYINGNTYIVDPDRWKELVEIAMDTARALIEATCKRIDVTEDLNK